MACHQFAFLERLDVLKTAEPGATFLLNSPHGPEDVWDHLPRATQEQIVTKRLRVTRHRRPPGGPGDRDGRARQHHHADLFLRDQRGHAARGEAIAAIKHAIEKTYSKRGEAVVQKNFAAVDSTLDHLHEVRVPGRVTSSFDRRPPVPSWRRRRSSGRWPPG